MIFGYTTSLCTNKITPELALIPTVVGDYSPPVAIKSLFETKNGVFYLGPKEAIVVELQEESLIIIPILPAIIYLTPDTNERPGIQAAKLMVSRGAEGEHIVSYARDRTANWQPWNPIAEQRM